MSRCVRVFFFFGRKGREKERKGETKTHQRQSPMPAHTMTENANALHIHHLSKGVEHGRRQLLRHVAVHPVVPVPGRVRGVEVETGAGAEIKGVVFAFDVETACTLRD